MNEENSGYKDFPEGSGDSRKRSIGENAERVREAQKWFAKYIEEDMKNELWIDDLRIFRNGRTIFFERGGELVLSRELERLNMPRNLSDTAEKLGVDEEELEKIVAYLNYDFEKSWTPDSGKEEEIEERERTKMKVVGYANEGYYEAIEHEGRPAFMVYDGNEFKILDFVHEGEETIRPPNRDETPYPPYHYYPGEVDTRSLVKEVFSCFDEHIDVEERHKVRWTVETFQSYEQEKILTTVYEFLVGAEGSGKTVTLIVMSNLIYRPLFGTSFSNADIYTYLMAHPFSSVLEDEIQGIENNKEKMKIYLVGYKQGAKVPRVFEKPNGERVINYYPCFGFKAVASRQVANDSAFMERFIIVKMMEGYPKKDEITQEDLEKFGVIRDKLLKWRIIHLKDRLEQVDPGVTGRFKEQWTPLLQVAKQLGLEDKIKEDLTIQYREYRKNREESLEAYILKAYLRAYRNAKDGYVPAPDIWESLKTFLEGKEDEKRDDLFHSTEFGDITKALVGRRLSDRLGGERRKIREEEGTLWAWIIPEDKLLRAVRRYLCSRVPELKPINEYNGSVIEIKCPYFNPEKGDGLGCDASTSTLQNRCKIGNTGTAVKLTRLEIKLLAPSVSRDPVPIFTLETKPLTTSKPYEGETPSQPPLETPSGTIDTTRNITKEQDSSAVKQPASDSSSNPATRERIKAYGAEGQPCVFCGKPGGSIRLRNEKILYAHDECMSKDYGGA